MALHRRTRHDARDIPFHVPQAYACGQPHGSVRRHQAHGRLGQEGAGRARVVQRREPPQYQALPEHGEGLGQIRPARGVLVPPLQGVAGQPARGPVLHAGLLAAAGT